MNWLTKESTNYIFHFKNNSLAEKDINKIINLQENCYDFIIRFLDIKMERKINYYLCTTPEEVGEIYGDNEPCNGFACEPDKVYAVYNDNVKCVGFHEDAHLISYNLAIPPQTFIREGLAMFFDKVSLKIDNYAWVKLFINNKMYIDINKLIINDNFYKFSDLITYPIAGAFTEFLILLFGKEKYINFYSSLDKNNLHSKFFENFEISLDDANTRFINYISSIKIDDTLVNIMKNELQKRDLFK